MPSRLEDKVDVETLRKLNDTAQQAAVAAGMRDRVPVLQGQTSGGGGKQWRAKPTAVALPGSSHNPQPFSESADYALVQAYRRGNQAALDALMLRYHQFVRLKASSYFLAGGDAEDLIQEGMLGLYKAVRDYRDDRLASFRSFAELCITRQIITAIKTATRQKHVPLNGYLSFSQSPNDCFRRRRLLAGRRAARPQHARPGQPGHQRGRGREPHGLSHADAVRPRGPRAAPVPATVSATSASPTQLGCDCKTVDNALQRIKRKVDLHLEGRKVLS